MAWANVDKMGVVEGATVYVKDETTDLWEDFPIAADTMKVTLPQITHPTYTIQMMGDAEISDQCRVNTMTTQFETELSVLESKLLGYGVKEYMIKWAQSMSDKDGNFKIVPFVAYIAGIPSEDVGSTVQTGENTTGTVTVQTLKYHLIIDNEEVRFVDKRSGKLRINGKDYREQINKML